MPSLWSMFHKRTIGRVPAIPKAKVDEVIQALKVEPPKLVNLNGWHSGTDEFDLKAMDATPGFRSMWFEWLMDNCRTACAVFRVEPKEILECDLIPPEARFYLQVFMLQDQDGDVFFRAAAGMFIDRMGCLTDKVDMLCDEGDNEAAAALLLAMCDVITTMNTRGTRIEPPFDSPRAKILKPDRAPCSVWHTIHLPRFDHPRLIGAGITPEILERRQHAVRAHRRDYRFGSGMFGRVKALVWVPEFQRGNPELGTVKQSYVVCRR